MQLFTLYILYKYIESNIIEETMADTTTIQIRPTETGWILSKKGKDGKDVTLEIADKDKTDCLILVQMLK